MTQKTIEFVDILHIRGPNTWAYCPVLEARLNLGELANAQTHQLPGFIDRLIAYLPSLAEHRCVYETEGGFMRSLQEGTGLAHVMEHVTLELQSLAGMPGGFGRAYDIPVEGLYRVVIEARHTEVTRAALHVARDLILAAVNDEEFDLAAAQENLVDLAETYWLGPSTASIVLAAEARAIPTVRLNDANLVQLGYGAGQRRIWTAETDRTSAIAEGISRDKDLTKQLLEICGVPVPEGRVVDSPEDAWDAAEDIGLPVVVKPYDGNHGRGVFTNLTTREQVETAYNVALDEGSGVIVERFILGVEHRLLVVGDKLVAANKGDEAKVVGDGKSTIYELIQSQINADPRRGNTEEHPLNLIRINSGSLLEITRQGYADEHAVPAVGVEVMIQRSGNHAFDVTDEVHPETAEIVALAARIVGLDIAGIDMVVQDISKPLREQGGAIVEVNAGPSLLMHLKPAVGKPRAVGKAIVDNLFKPHETGRIPVVGVAGSVDRTPVAKLVARLIRLMGKQTGLACSEGMYIDQRLLEAGDRGAWEPARRLLMNRNIEAMVCETSNARLLREGLPYDQCQIGIVLGIDLAETEPAYHLTTPEDLYSITRTQIDVVLPAGAGVLNAGDPLVAKMAELCRGEVMYFATDIQNTVLQAHVAAGKRAVSVRNGQIVLLQGSTVTELVPLASLPPGASDGDTLLQLLAATAAGWALAVPNDLLCAGLVTFDQTLLARIAG